MTELIKVEMVGGPCDGLRGGLHAVEWIMRGEVLVFGTARYRLVTDGAAIPKQEADGSYRYRFEGNRPGA